MLFTVRTFNSHIAWNSNIRSCLSWSFDTRQRERSGDQQRVPMGSGTHGKAMRGGEWISGMATNSIFKLFIFYLFVLGCIFALCKSIKYKRPWKALPFTIKLYKMHWNSAKVQQIVHNFPGSTSRLPLRFGQFLKGEGMNKKNKKE